MSCGTVQDQLSAAAFRPWRGSSSELAQGPDRGSRSRYSLTPVKRRERPRTTGNARDLKALNPVRSRRPRSFASFL